MGIINNKYKSAEQELTPWTSYAPNVKISRAITACGRGEKMNCMLVRICLSFAREFTRAGRWLPTPLIPALERQRQADLCEFGASLIYKS